MMNVVPSCILLTCCLFRLRDNDELVERIVQFNRKEYEERLEQFFKEWGRYNYDGTATKKAVDRLLNG